MAGRKTWGATPHKPTALLGNARATAARNGVPTDPAATNTTPTVPPVQQQHGTDPAPVVVAAAANLAVTANQQPPGGDDTVPLFQSREMRAAMEQPFNIDEFMAEKPAAPAQNDAVASGSGQNPFQHLAEKAGLKLPKMPSKHKLSISKPKFKLPELKLGSITNHSPSQPGQSNRKVPNSARVVTIDETGNTTIDAPLQRPPVWLANRPAPVDSPRNQAMTSPRRPALARLPVEPNAQEILDNLQPGDWALEIPPHADLDFSSQGSDSGASTDGSVDLEGANLSLWPEEVTNEQIDQLLQALGDDLAQELEKKQQ